MRKVILVFIISILFLLVSADWPTNNFEESISDIFMSFRTGTFHEAIDIPLQNINDMVFSINKAKIDGENIINPKILHIERRGYNSYIIIGFSDDTAFVYGHILARADLEEGKQISYGTYLGKFAYTNGASYPHIHFQSTPDIVNPKD